MKTYLKITITLLLLNCVNGSAQVQDTVSRSKTQAQNTTSSPQTVVIRMTESIGMVRVDSKIATVTPDNEILSKTIEHINLLGMNKDVEQNARLLQQELQKWQNQGFQVKGTTTNTFDRLLITMIILQKD